MSIAASQFETELNILKTDTLSASFDTIETYHHFDDELHQIVNELHRFDKCF